MILIRGLWNSPMVWQFKSIWRKKLNSGHAPPETEMHFFLVYKLVSRKNGCENLIFKIKIESNRRGGHSKITKAPWDFPWSLEKIKNTYLHLIKWFPNRVRRMMWLLLYGQTTVSSSGLKFDLPFLQGPGTKSNGIVSSKNLEMKTWIIQSKNSSFRFSKLLDW